jgi:4-hydroxy-3-methylbut-2-enyl diphosphate reductase
MSDNEGIMSQQEEYVSFSDMIYSIPQLHRGATVKGIIVRYDGDNVYVDVHDKSEGRIPRHEFESDPDFDLDQAIAEHTEIDVYVRSIRNSELGKEILLSKARVDFGKYKALIEEAFANKTPISVKVVNVVKEASSPRTGLDNTSPHPARNVPVEDWSIPRADAGIVVTPYDPTNAVACVRIEGVCFSMPSGVHVGRGLEHHRDRQCLSRRLRSPDDFGAFVDFGGVDRPGHVSSFPGTVSVTHLSRCR